MERHLYTERTSGHFYRSQVDRFRDLAGNLFDRCCFTSGDGCLDGGKGAVVVYVC